MTIVLAVIVSLILFAISILHFYWAFGGLWAKDLSVPTNEKQVKVLNPGAFECIVVAAGLLSIVFCVMARATLISVPLPSWLASYGLWFVASIFLLRAIGDFRYVGFFKSVRATPFGVMDTRLYSPLFLAIAIALILIQSGF